MTHFDRITTVLLDGDGVLWRAEEPIPGIREFTAFLNQNRIHWALLTNNNTRTAQDYVDKLIRFGIHADPSVVFTSSSAAADHALEAYGPGAPLHVVGMSGLIDTLIDAGFDVHTGETPPPQPVRAVVAGMDRQITHDKIKTAMRLIMAGADFIATNTDGSFVTAEGFNPGTGMVIAALEATSGVKPLVIGKPEAGIFRTAMKRFAATPETTLMVGDRLDTDILGARRLGLRTAAVLTGVTSREQLAASEIRPDMVFEDIRGLHRAMENEIRVQQ